MTTVTVPPSATADRLRFVEPLPGFDEEEAFTLSGIDPDGVLYALRSVRDPSLRFVLSPAETFFVDYRPDLGAGVPAALGSASGADLRLLVMLTIGSGLLDATANLRAPIVVATETGNAMQVVLDDESLSMRAPIVAR